jgi:RNA polymerase sigma-70 factor, ECF subfamily
MTTLLATQSESPSMDETQLAREAISNVDAFAELYRLHVTRVYRYHMAHVGNVKDAEDLTSQTFMAALEGIKSFRGSGSVAAWIMGIASKKRLMFFRRNGSRHEIQLDAALHYPSSSLPTDKAATQRLKLESVSRALKQIPPDRAEAITLSFFGGLSNIETSRVLNKSEAAVKMLISRGLQDLRERTSLALEVEL